MPVHRRLFLKSGGLALVGIGSGLSGIPRFLTRAAAGPTEQGKVLVVIFLRGAADGLNIVVPHGEDAYYRMRPNIAVPRPVPGRSGTAIDLDGFFGLHPNLEPLHSLYESGRLAVIHAAGSPHISRSHFDAQDFMESGTPGRKSTPDGWLNRYLQEPIDRQSATFRAVSVTRQVPRILGGRAPALAIPDLARFGFKPRPAVDLMQHGLLELYAASDDSILAPTVSETFHAIDQVKRLQAAKYKPTNGVSYPGGRFGRDLQQVAQLIKADVGLEIAFTEIGGWDHHVNEGGATGSLAVRLRQLGDGIAGLVHDLGPRMDDVVLVTLSEFGRTAAENGNRGTDHGHANTMFVVGGSVAGGRCYGRWPGLETEQLNEGRDLALTTDFREVLAQLLTGHLGANRLDRTFPGFSYASRSDLNLIPDSPA